MKVEKMKVENIVDVRKVISKLLQDNIDNIVLFFTSSKGEEFSCGISDDYNCYVPYDYVCDGVHDCPNGRDESKCGKKYDFLGSIINGLCVMHESTAMFRYQLSCFCT